jgi:hypothetical protein
MGIAKIRGKFLLILHTVKYLKPVQVFYQIYYRIKIKKPFCSYLPKKDVTFNKLQFNIPIRSKQIILSKNHFRFLNLEKQFEKQIDWNFQGLGKLWNYNLQYLDYLFQEDIEDDEKLRYLGDITAWLQSDKLQLQAYPVSLRVINEIRYFSSKTEDKAIIHTLYAQLNYLYQNPEYQILGNHLLENAFTLFMGGYAFDNVRWKTKGQNLLYNELEKQLLPDGAHFELSPMYHKIILFRLLELIDWYSKIADLDTDFSKFIWGKAINMLNWLYTISLGQYTIPHFNDSADNITYSNKEIFEFAKQLNLPVPVKIKLKESGYRKFEKGKYQSIVDVGPIGASYQPGHAHADALSFVLYYEEKPFLVEAGTSTYQIGDIRNQERSTQAHNTVVVNENNQSEVWSGFRVGNRAQVLIEKESNDFIKASHNGYKQKYRIIHERSFLFRDNQISVIDALTGNQRKNKATAYFHFHPDRTVVQNDNVIYIDGSAKVVFEKAEEILLFNYHFSDQFNEYQIGKVAAIRFSHQLSTTIYLD